MDRYEKNKAVLQKRYPDVIEKLEKEEYGKKEGWDVQIIDTRDQNHAVVVEAEGKKYRLNSAYRPLEEAKKWAEQYEFQNIDVNIFMFGFGNGYFVREILKRAAKDAKVFLWEPDATIFSVILEKEDIADIFEDERFYFFMDKEEFAHMKDVMLSIMGWHNVSTQIECFHICYDKIFKEEYEDFFGSLLYKKRMVKMQEDTNAWFADSAVNHVLENLKYIRHSNFVTEFIGRIDEDIPVIIVSGGPSLDKNVELLKEAYGKSFIIATDTAVQFLEKRGLPYDCMITVDPKKPPFYLTKYSGCKDKVLFCLAQSPSKLMEFHTGRKVWYCGSVYVEYIYNSFGLLFPPYSAGGSVATAAIVLARLLGLKNIILIGQDLAFSGESTHAGGLKTHILNEEKGIEFVEGVDGTPVRTRHDWQAYRKWIEDFIEVNAEYVVVDATEGGALIHGSEILTFEEAIQKYCAGKSFSFENLMNDLPETFEVLDFKPVYEKITSMEKGIPAILKRSEEAKKMAEEYLKAGKKLSAKKHDRILRDLKKANNFIQKQEGYELIETYNYKMITKDLQKINQITGDTYTDDRNSVKIAESLYSNFIQAAKELGPKVNDALQSIGSSEDIIVNKL